MYQAWKYLNKKSLVGLYNSYIYPYLIYCVESWGNIAKCHLDPLLFILQKKIIRIITFSSYDKSAVSFRRTEYITPMQSYTE